MFMVRGTTQHRDTIVGYELRVNIEVDYTFLDVVFNMSYIVIVTTVLLKR